MIGVARTGNASPGPTTTKTTRNQRTQSICSVHLCHLVAKLHFLCLSTTREPQLSWRKEQKGIQPKCVPIPSLCWNCSLAAVSRRPSFDQRHDHAIEWHVDERFPSLTSTCCGRHLTQPVPGQRIAPFRRGGRCSFLEYETALLHSRH